MTTSDQHRFDLERLREQLARYEASDAVDAAHRSRMESLLEQSADPLARVSFRPGHFTASAFVLSPDRTRVLLIHHAKLDRWLQPGGHIEPEDADVLDAARREVSEETGLTELDAPATGEELLDVDIHAIPAHGLEPAHEHFDLRTAFLARDTDVAAGDGVRAARWFRFDELEDVAADASVRRAIRRLRTSGRFGLT